MKEKIYLFKYWTLETIDSGEILPQYELVYGYTEEEAEAKLIKKHNLGEDSYELATIL